MEVSSGTQEKASSLAPTPGPATAWPWVLEEQLCSGGTGSRPLRVAVSSQMQVEEAERTEAEELKAGWEGLEGTGHGNSESGRKHRVAGVEEAEDLIQALNFSHVPDQGGPGCWTGWAQAGTTGPEAWQGCSAGFEAEKEAGAEGPHPMP